MLIHQGLFVLDRHIIIASTIARYPVLPNDRVRCVFGVLVTFWTLQYFVTTEKYFMDIVGLKIIIAVSSHQWLLYLLEIFLLVTLCLSM